jgi:hypothetical protein
MNEKEKIKYACELSKIEYTNSKTCYEISDDTFMTNNDQSLS